MSVDISWDNITSGPDGAALSESVRDFIHAKFQQIALPRFINSVQVHSFEFGSISPQIEIKDICDPLPDFYEDDGDDEGDEPTPAELPRQEPNHLSTVGQSQPSAPADHRTHNRYGQANVMSPIEESSPYDPARALAATLQARFNGRPGIHGVHEAQVNAFPRSSTPGIPGGTSNLSYFHLPRGGFSGTQTPLVALAGGTPFSPGWHHDPHQDATLIANESQHSDSKDDYKRSDSISSPEIGSPFDPSSPESRPTGFSATEQVNEDLHLDGISLHSALRDDMVAPEDLQVVARVTYEGDVRMTLTAEILLDYPMPSFVGIPLKLSVTGMKFDGIAIIAYIKKRMHFCFLDPDDAQTLVGDQILNETPPEAGSQSDTKSVANTFGSLLREVQIESEIGRQESGKQVLKNVGKVEKFVLEQVKKIFEEEFVFPSFWTFLV